MRKFLYISLIALAIFIPSNAVHCQILSSEAEMTLLSCSPGKPLYFHFGHTALRVQDPACILPDGTQMPIDWVFNYGIFDFNTEHFYVKFTKGETDYMLGLETTAGFLYGAACADRHVSFQPLRMDSAQKQQIMDALVLNYQPENRTYRYNFVYDNCATRVWKLIRNATDIQPSEELSGMTWRKAIDYYSGRYTWGKYGISMVFGYEADKEMTVEQSLFLPENLMNYVSDIGITENEDIAPFTPRDGNFATSPELAELILILIIAIFTIIDIRKKKFSWGIDVAFFTLFTILGIVISILYFFSSHPFVGSNMNILLLNPLWITGVILLCIKKTRRLPIRFGTWVLLYACIFLVVLRISGQAPHIILALVIAEILRLHILHRAETAESRKCRQNPKVESRKWKA